MESNVFMPTDLTSAAAPSSAGLTGAAPRKSEATGINVEPDMYAHQVQRLQLVWNNVSHIVPVRRSAWPFHSIGPGPRPCTDDSKTHHRACSPYFF